MIKGVYVTLKLISGEEIVAAVTDETEYDITVMLPMLVKTYIKTLKNPPKQIEMINHVGDQELYGALAWLCRMSSAGYAWVTTRSTEKKPGDIYAILSMM